MSAFMVSKRHIDLLVSTAFSGPRDATGGHWYKPNYQGSQCWDFDTLPFVGQMLIDANIKSLNARYPDTVTNPEAMPGPIAQYWNDGQYKAPSLRDRLTIVEAFKAIACYEYQACEDEGWEQSYAHQFLDSFRHSLINVLPGYDDARGWDDWERKTEAA